MENRAILISSVCIGLVCLGSFFGHNWETLGAVMAHRGDDLGYYQFLPGLFIEHDLRGLPWVHILEDGSRLSVFTMGVALLQLPFFVIAHLACHFGLASPDAYSWPYAVARAGAGAFYAAMGCLFLMRALKPRFGTSASVIAVALLCGCTNLYYYASMEPGMSHVYSFFLFAALYHTTLGILRSPSSKRLFLLLVIVTMILLVRAANVIVLLVPLLYAASRTKDVVARLNWPLRFPKAFIMGVMVCALMLLPQLTYWHAITGKFLVFTYGAMGQGFFWSQPHLWDVLLHPWNGWFLYSPLMLVVMAALLVMAVRGIPGGRTVLLVWLLAWYVIAAWWCWWLGGAFGHRGFVEYLAFLAVPAAWMVQGILRSSRTLKYAALAVALFLAYLNIGLSWNYASPWDGPEWTMASVWREYGRLLP
ncbi:MAG: hypothetical protein WAT61_09545 [Flavobacteriales bacterium]